MSQRTSKMPVLLSALVLKPAVAEKAAGAALLDGDFVPKIGDFPKLGFLNFGG